MSNAAGNPKVDPVAAWRSLPADAQERIGAAAIAHVLGAVGAYDGINPHQAFEAADGEGFQIIEDVLKDHLKKEAFTPDGLARRPDLTPLGIRSCSVCGCTDVWGCAEGCSWASEDVCSRCARTHQTPGG